MTKLWLLIISLVLLTCSLDDEVVPCPADDQNFSNCFICKQVHRSEGNIYCACTKQQFKLLGSCLQAQYPCKLILTNLMYDEKEKEKGFNIWDIKISALLLWKFEEAMKTQTFPDPLPEYMNDMDFLGMPEAFRQGWGQAYFLYLGLQNEIKQLDNLAQDSLIVESLKLFQQIKNKSYEQQWKEVTEFVNLKLHTHWSVANFTKIIEQRIRHVIPCHGCTWLYGFLHIKSQNKCYKCPPGCTVCENNTSDCAECLPGFFLNKTSKQCQPCAIGHCNNCTAEGVCVQCQQDMILFQNVCHHPQYYCSSNCQSCEPGNPHHCTSCSVIDYSVAPNKQDKKCFKCDQQACMMCTPENTTFCWQCLRGFYGDHNGKCNKCMDGCLICQNQHNCTECRYGFSIHNNTCSQCEVAGCKLCPNDTKVCEECLTQNLVLDPETKTCKVFDGATLNYHFLEPRLNCSRGCVFCYNNNTQQCHTCDMRYFLDPTLRMCRKCMSGCIQCLDQKSCMNCQSGYYQHENKCAKCLGQNCHCESDGKCTVCFEGYHPSENGCSLIMQPYGCEHFDSQNTTVCKICEPGFAKTSDQKCIQCQSHCKLSCNPHNISQCIQSRYQMARPYYYMSLKDDQTCFYVNGNCVAPKIGYQIREINGAFVSHRICFHPCSQCDKDYVCFKCKIGYNLVEGACVPDISCNPKCQHCLSGSQRDLQTHACVLCSVSHCSTCHSTNCIQCNQGFYLQTLQASQSCKKCPQSCRICINSEDCNVCAVGYFRQQQMKCQKCSQNCLSCEHLRTKCLSCGPGSRLIGNRCIGLHSVQFYYRVKGSAEQFMQKMRAEAFLTQLSKLLSVKKQDIFLLNTTSKPLSISGLISSPTQVSSYKIYSDLQSAQISNFQVQCHSLSRFHEKQRINYYSNLQTTCEKKQDDDNDDDKNEGLSGGAIAAIVICSIIASIALIVGIVKAVRKVRSRDVSWSTEHSNQMSLGSEGYYQQYMDTK